MNEQDKVNDAVYVKETNTKKAYNKAIEELGQEYDDYFKNRMSMYENEEHDKIENHFTTYKRGNGEEVFAINNDSDIKDEIKNKLLSIYKEYSPIYH